MCTRILIWNPAVGPSVKIAQEDITSNVSIAFNSKLKLGVVVILVVALNTVLVIET